MLCSLAVSSYRSLRDIIVPLNRLNLVTGPNAVGSRTAVAPCGCWLDLLPALGRLIAAAAARSQIIVVSHAAGLIDTLQQQPDCHSIQLGKTFGETKVVTADETVRPGQQWPTR